MSLTAPAGNASFRRLGRETVIYGLGAVLGRAVSFLMLPVYTRFLSPADYGVLQLLDLTVDVAAIFFTAGATSGVQRFYFKTTDPAARARLLSTTFFLVLTLSTLGALTLGALSPWIWTYGLKEAGQPWFIVVAAANFAAGTLMTMPLSFAQTTQRARLFLGFSLAKLVLQLSLNILFVVVLKAGVAGLLFSTLITYLLLGGSLAIWLLRQTGLHFDLGVVRDLRRFGVPYQLTWAGSFLLTFGDRFFLQAGRGVAAVGLYGMAYQFGFLLSQLGAMPFLSAWNPHRHQLVPLPVEQRDRRYDQGFFYLNLLLITVAMGIAVFIRPVIKVMTTAEFHPAAYLVPIILLAYVAEAWAEVFRFAFDVTEHTRYSTYATWITVAVVMVLYMVLIPPYRRLRCRHRHGTRVFAARGACVPVGPAPLANPLPLAASPGTAGPRPRRGRNHLGDAEHDDHDANRSGRRRGAGVRRCRLPAAAGRRRTGADQADGELADYRVGDCDEGVVSGSATA